MFISDGPVSIRKMHETDEDYSLLLKWLNDKKVLSYIENPNTSYTLEQIVGKYGPRARGDHYVTPCIIEFKHTSIGYLQYYQLQEAEITDYGARDDRLQYGLDIFIGEPDYWNFGIGTVALKAVIQYLLTEQKEADIYIDPQTWNVRAIKSYEKCGFKKVKILHERELFDGVYKDNQLMKITMEEFNILHDVIE